MISQLLKNSLGWNELAEDMEHFGEWLSESQFGLGDLGAKR
jgi:hypothetical protein